MWSCLLYSLDQKIIITSLLHSGIQSNALQMLAYSFLLTVKFWLQHVLRRRKCTLAFFYHLRYLIAAMKRYIPIFTLCPNYM
jgi:hypothetical protein